MAAERRRQLERRRRGRKRRGRNGVRKKRERGRVLREPAVIPRERMSRVLSWPYTDISHFITDIPYPENELLKTCPARRRQRSTACIYVQTVW